MKKKISIIGKILLGLVLLIILLLFTLPVLFREKIRTKVEHTINQSVNATVKFEDYNIGFFRNFPNLSFSLNNISVVGIGKFEKDTLADIKSFRLVFNLSSLFKKSGYEVKSIDVDKAAINTIVLKDGSANWDIMKDTKESSTAASESEPSTLKIVLNRVSLNNSSISYIDDESNIKAFLNKFSFNMKGDMTGDETDMQLTMNIGEFTYIMDGVKYLNNAVVTSKSDLLANIGKMKFTFRENYLSVNDLTINFSGAVAMPGDDIETDLKFATSKTNFSSLLSLIPAVYMKDYKDLTTSGEFTLSGSAKGIYSDADSTMPDLALNLSVDKGLIGYPSLPEKIKNINIKSNLFIDGKVMDRTTVSVSMFHFDLAGNPFDMNFNLKTPVSDPDIAGSLTGRIDLSALSKAVPMDSLTLSGIVDMSVKMAGRLSMIEKGQYENFKASGSMGINNMLVGMKGYPPVKISRAAFEFTPAVATMTNTHMSIGRNSDFDLTGSLSDYIPYILKNKTIKGKLTMHSKLTDVSEILAGMSSNSTNVTDTTSLALIKVPENIDFDFAAMIDQLKYGTINGQNVKGHLIVRNGILSIKETGMDIMKGKITINADYDTRDTIKPEMKADLDIQNIGVKDAFNAFNTLKEMAPASKGIDGKVSVKLVFASLLKKDMSPLTKSIKGEGKLKSDEITLVDSEIFTKMKSVLKLGDKYNNTFKDINISFKIDKGRIYVSPFNVKTGNLKMNISGDQGIDQTINYIVKTEMPRSDLGSSVNSFIDNLAAQASSFGISYKPSSTIKVNLQVTGTFTKPVISPFFGNTAGDSSTDTKTQVKEITGNTVDNVKDKAVTEGEKAAVSYLREAEEKGNLLRAEAAKTAEAFRKEANLQADKLVKESASKSTLEKLAAQKGAETIRKTADKKAGQILKDADAKANKLMEEAKLKGDQSVGKK